jgi:hypothetical protein
MTLVFALLVLGLLAAILIALGIAAASPRQVRRRVLFTNV